jgi:hypothetical protein
MRQLIGRFRSLSVYNITYLSFRLFLCSRTTAKGPLTKMSESFLNRLKVQDFDLFNDRRIKFCSSL